MEERLVFQCSTHGQVIWNICASKWLEKIIIETCMLVELNAEMRLNLNLLLPNIPLMMKLYILHYDEMKSMPNLQLW